MLSRLDAALFRRVGARPLGVARVVVGVGAVLKAVQAAPWLAEFERSGVLRLPYAEWAPSVTDLPAWVTVGAWTGAAVLFTIGLFTTVAGSVLTALLVAVLGSDQQLYSNHLYLLTLLVGLLTLARSGSAVSLDSRLGRGAAEVANWPLLLLRLQLSVVYLFAGLSKINAEFLSGTVVAVTLRRDGPLAVPTDWRTFEPMLVLSLLAVLTELFLAIALWLPRWRRAAFVVGLGLHVGIAVWFSPTAQLAIFSLIILAPYILFLDASPRAAVVAWDDSCGFCAGWVRLFQSLDWLHALRFVPASDAPELLRLGVPREDADRALQLVRRGRRSQGFSAVAGIAELLPICFLWAPLLRLPPIAWAGDRLYRRVAGRRSCSLPLHAGAS